MKNSNKIGNNKSEEEVNAQLCAEKIVTKCGGKIILEDLSVSIIRDKFTVIIGSNACGKSTLLKSLSNLLKPDKGSVLLDGKDIRAYKTKKIARKLGVLPQSPVAPSGITVADLVSRGRYPYQSIIRQWTDEDEEAVLEAMKLSDITCISDRYVDELSGGQRQRVWIAMLLAQKTSIILLDEPTTYLDITHQIELLELLKDLNKNGRTIVAVLHDLNQAARYATHIIAMKGGNIIAEGEPKQVITEKNVKEVFGLESIIIDDPVTHTPLVVPIGK